MSAVTTLQASAEIVAATVAAAAMSPAHAIALGALIMTSAGPARTLVRFRRWMAAALAAHAPIVAVRAQNTPPPIAMVVVLTALPVAVYCWARAVHVARSAGRDVHAMRMHVATRAPPRAATRFAPALGVAAIVFILVAALLATVGALAGRESLPRPFLSV